MNDANNISGAINFWLNLVNKGTSGQRKQVAATLADLRWRLTQA